jgi:hypothetical protein
LAGKSLKRLSQNSPSLDGRGRGGGWKQDVYNTPTQHPLSRGRSGSLSFEMITERVADNSLLGTDGNE